MKKIDTHLAILLNFQYLDSLFTTWKNHLQILNKNFEKVYIINTENLQFFPKHLCQLKNFDPNFFSL